MANCLSMVAMVFVLYGPLVVGALVRSPTRRKPTEERADAHGAVHGVAMRLSVLILLGVTWWRGWWRPEDLSPSTVSPLVAVAVGLAAYGLHHAAYRVVRRRFSRRRASRTEPRVYLNDLKNYWPRTRTGRALVALRHLLNPPGEELAFRGVLFGFVAQATGSLVAGGVIGCAAAVALHAYQGRKNMAYHAVFFVVAAALLWGAGILAPIVFHVAHSAMDLRPGQLAHVRNARAWERYERAKQRKS